MKMNKIRCQGQRMTKHNFCKSLTTVTHYKAKREIIVNTYPIRGETQYVNIFIIYSEEQ